MLRYALLAPCFSLLGSVASAQIALDSPELFVTTPGSKANPDTHYLHLAVCAEEIGVLPALSQMQKIEIAPPKNHKGGCDKHSLAGISICKPSTFYGWREGSVQWIGLTRTQDGGRPRTGFIGWNAASGKSCFFDDNGQAPAKEHPKDKYIRVTDKAGDLNQFLKHLRQWARPEEFIGIEACVTCHQGNDPYLGTHYVRTGFSGYLRKMDYTPEDSYRYQIIGLYRHRGWIEEAPLLTPKDPCTGEDDGSCTGCHVIAATGEERRTLVANIMGFDNLAGAIKYHESKGLRASMPPDSSDSSRATRVAKRNVLRCLQREGDPECYSGKINWAPEQKGCADNLTLMTKEDVEVRMHTVNGQQVVELGLTEAATQRFIRASYPYDVLEMMLTISTPAEKDDLDDFGGASTVIFVSRTAVQMQKGLPSLWTMLQRAAVRHIIL